MDSGAIEPGRRAAARGSIASGESRDGSETQSGGKNLPSPGETRRGFRTLGAGTGAGA